ncbi:hypothetical protein K8354_00725 [Polaribacter litorisediminis]|uniref:hypothetical protein n=1 Tax=Polaribacter litorisediminis TaxID=1908341 RepID=UPI001CBD18A6|nr:hypothetical protein [Polaribacter litorisediminis]UAM98384.1 hypothetical protein K8354_00725 [Polaribacter litorisediminis]
MNEVKERQKLSWEGMFYSIQRIDLLIVSISGAGIYVCLETIKYLSDKSLDVNLLIRISGGLFLFGIIINFLSQVFGYKTNQQDFLMCQVKIDAGKKVSKKEQIQIDTYDNNSEKYSKWTDIFNYLSIGFMFLGLILIMTYFLFIF